jgi:hypothetical protein
MDTGGKAQTVCEFPHNHAGLRQLAKQARFGHTSGPEKQTLQMSGCNKAVGRLNQEKP